MVVLPNIMLYTFQKKHMSTHSSFRLTNIKKSQHFEHAYEFWIKLTLLDD